SDAAIHVLARAGPRPLRLAPLLTIHDRHQREILLLGVDGDDIVYRYRTRAIASRLLAPEVRVRGALRGIAWRDPLTIMVRPANSAYCDRVNAADHCGLGYTIGSGWAFLLGDQPASPWLRPALSVGWVGVLFFPIGRWAGFGWTFGVSAALSLASLL